MNPSLKPNETDTTLTSDCILVANADTMARQ